MGQYSLINCRDAKIKVGIFGGSFNPPHQGHLYVSEEAIKRLELQFVIWLVTPQNPLKSLTIKSTLEARVVLAKNLIGGNRKIIVSDFEKDLPNTYTVNTIRRLKLMHPHMELAWIMGADSICEMGKWKNWPEIIHNNPLIVFDRNPYTYGVMNSQVVQSANSVMVCNSITGPLKKNNVYFVRIKRHPLSSTQLRQQEKQVFYGEENAKH